MQSFVFYSPTEIAFGKGAEEKTGLLAKKYGGTKIFVVYGGGSVEKSGLLKKISDSLEAQNLQYFLFGGAKPNPLLSHAREGVKSAVDFNADFVLGVGGGSAIDTAKAIAHGAKNPETDIWKFWKRETELTRTLPVGVVLTISAAGSETSNSSVLTNSETGEKRGLGTDLNRPRFAVMNPELTYTVPKYQISCGIADIMMHTVERYFSHTQGNELTDGIAAALMKTVIKNGSVLVGEPSNYDAASEIMWAGSLSHNGITGLGRPFDFPVHQIGHELSGKFDVAHGASLSTIWGSWAKYVHGENPARFAKYAKEVWDVDENDEETSALAGIAKTVEFFKAIGCPTCFSELGIEKQGKDAIDAMADSCVFHGKRTVGMLKQLGKSEIIDIYNLANR
ncbi:MAG: iron-containing alcohol dehydrogenase [Oscillospiraceae bacterium]|nr:iron-containing alcohol dehydrogenase [Oscillospiraceae bacterium]